MLNKEAGFKRIDRMMTDDGFTPPKPGIPWHDAGAIIADYVTHLRAEIKRLDNHIDEVATISSFDSKPMRGGM